MTIKSKQRFSWSEDHETGIVKCLDKDTKETRSYDYADLPEEIDLRGRVYFIKKILQDRESGTDADDKLDGFDTVWQMLSDGTWEKERTGGGFGVVSPIIEVIMAAKKWTVSKAQAAWKDSSPELKAALLEEYAKDIEAIKTARKEQPTESLDDMLKA